MDNANKENFDELILSFSLNNCKKDYSYKIEFSFPDDLNPFETELIKNNSENGNLIFSKTLLCPYYFYKVQDIKINVQKTKDRLFIKNKIRDNYLTLSLIISSKNASLKTPLKNDAENSEVIDVTAEIRKANINNYTLFDYIVSGISFDSYIGIDFSDKELNNPDMENNQYIKSIKGFRETLFDFVRNFEVYGYGSKLKNNNKPYFNLSLNDDPSLFGYNNIKNAYEKCLNQIEYNGNNDNILSPLLKFIQKRIYEKPDYTKYNIFFLLISNSPKNEDIQNCIDYFIDNSFLPLSVVIIGIGSKKNEFTKIKNIFNDHIQSSKGIKKKREYVYFTTMEECNYDENILKNICLKEIPKQMVEFYKLAETTPKQIQKQNYENIKNSIKFLDLINILYQNKDDDSAPPILINLPKNNHISNNIPNNLNKNQNNNIFVNNVDKYENAKDNNINKKDKNIGIKKDNNPNSNLFLKKQNSIDYTQINNTNINNIINPRCTIRKKSKIKKKTLTEKNPPMESFFSKIPKSKVPMFVNSPKEEITQDNVDKNKKVNKSVNIIENEGKNFITTDISTPENINIDTVTKKEDESNIINNEKNQYNNEKKQHNEDEKKYMNIKVTLKDENNNMNTLKEEDNNKKCFDYLDTSGKEEIKTNSNNINNNQTQFSKDEGLNYNNNNNEKKYVIIADSICENQNINENQYQNNYQCNFNNNLKNSFSLFSEEDTSNPIQPEICDVEYHCEESQIRFDSKNNLDENKYQNES